MIKTVIDNINNLEYLIFVRMYNYKNKKKNKNQKIIHTVIVILTIHTIIFILIIHIVNKIAFLILKLVCILLAIFVYLNLECDSGYTKLMIEIINILFVIFT